MIKFILLTNSRFYFHRVPHVKWLHLWLIMNYFKLKLLEHMERMNGEMILENYFEKVESMVNSSEENYTSILVLSF